MTLRKKIWKVAKYFPVCISLDYIMDKTKPPRKMNYLKSAAELMYNTLPFVVLISWGITAIGTGTLNPFEQRRILIQRAKEAEVYDEKWKKVFGKGGYADKNNNGLSISELADAYKRMDLEDTIVNSECKQHGFVECLYLPPSENLERAVQSYEAEQEGVK